MLRRSLLESATATLDMGSLNTDSSVLFVVSGGREVRGGVMPSDSVMLYDVTMSVRGEMTEGTTTGMSRSLRSCTSETAVGVSVGRMGRGMAVPNYKRRGEEREGGRGEGKKWREEKGKREGQEARKEGGEEEGGRGVGIDKLCSNFCL